MMKELNFNQVQNVSGGAAFLAHPAVVGGAMGGLGYLGSAAVSGNFSWGGFGASIAAGATGAGILGGSAVSAARGYFATRVSFGGGITIGLMDRK